MNLANISKQSVNECHKKHKKQSADLRQLFIRFFNDSGLFVWLLVWSLNGAYADQLNISNPIMFVTQFPIAAEFPTIGSSFANHTNNRCSVTGGFRFRGPERSYRGHYLFADVCSREVFWGTELTANNWGFSPLITHSGPITSFGEDQAGNLYVVDYSQGIFQLTDANGLIFNGGFDTP